MLPPRYSAHDRLLIGLLQTVGRLYRLIFGTDLGAGLHRRDQLDSGVQRLLIEFRRAGRTPARTGAADKAEAQNRRGNKSQFIFLYRPLPQAAIRSASSGNRFFQYIFLRAALSIFLPAYP